MKINEVGGSFVAENRQDLGICFHLARTWLSPSMSQNHPMISEMYTVTF